MQYSPKLKTAAEEIKAVLAKHDIGAIVILHTPGFAEFVNKIDPSYSCCTLQATGELRMRAKLDDFGGNKAEWKKTVEASLGMLHTFVEVGEMVLGPLATLRDKISVIVDAEHYSGGLTSHDTQNN